jgi:glutathione S-transferase
MNALAIVLAILAAVVAWYLYERSRRRTHPVTGGLHPDITLPHAAAFELYGNAFSHCSRKTRLVMAELGIAFVHKPIDLIETGSYETLSPAYLRVNPSGLIPTLVHNGHPVYESDDIMAYATLQAGPSAPRLVPDDPALRARMDEWIAFGNLSSRAPTADMKNRIGACVPVLTLPLFIAAIQHIPLHRILFGLLFHPDKARPVFFALARVLGLRRMLGLKPLRGMILEGRQYMAAHLKRIDDALAQHGGPWLLGEQFTLADISMACVLLRVEETCFLAAFNDGGVLPHLMAYYDRLRARPSWQAAIREVTHPVIEQGVRELRAARAADASIARLLAAPGPA